MEFEVEPKSSAKVQEQQNPLKFSHILTCDQNLAVGNRGAVLVKCKSTRRVILQAVTALGVRTKQPVEVAACDEGNLVRLVVDRLRA